MIEYSVVLKRHNGSNRPDAIVFRDEDRAKAVKEMQKYAKAVKAMQKYCKEKGWPVKFRDGLFTIADIVLVEKEPIAGAPVISETSYIELFSE